MAQKKNRLFHRQRQGNAAQNISQKKRPHRLLVVRPALPNIGLQ